MDSIIFMDFHLPWLMDSKIVDHSSRSIGKLGKKRKKGYPGFEAM